MSTPKLRAIFVVGWLWACQAGCGGGSSSPIQQKIDAAVPKTTLRIATYLTASPDQMDALQVIIDAYKAGHPNTDIVIETVVVNPIKSAGQLMTPAGVDGGIENGWDLTIQSTTTWTSVPDFKSMMLDLNSSERLAAIKGKFLPALAAEMNDAGKWLGLPIGVARFNTSTYNVSALNKLGVTTPPHTFDQVMAICNTFIGGGASQLPSVWVTPGSASAGVAIVGSLLVDPPGTGHVAFGTSSNPVPVMRKALETLQFYLRNGCLEIATDKNGNGTASDDGQDMVLQGVGAATIGPVWMLAYLRANGQGGSDNYVACPTVDGAPYIYVGEYLIVNEASPNREQAIDFLLAAADTGVQLNWLKRRGGAPAILFSDPDTQILDRELLAEYKEFVSSYGNNNTGNWQSWFSDSAKAKKYIVDFLSDAGKTPEKVDAFIKGMLCDEPRYPDQAFVAQFCL